MSPQGALCDDFEKWADSRLRPLLDAKREDARLGNGRKRSSKFGELLKYYMDEYELLPIAKSTHTINLGQDGKPHSTDAELRKKADRYLRNHSKDTSCKLRNFETSGTLAADNPFRITSAIELWAGTDKARIRALTCAELGIPVNTATAELPPGFMGARKRVVKREFNLLPLIEQEEFHSLARDRKEAASLERAEPMLVQDRQENLAQKLAALMEKKFAHGGLGRTFVIQYSGFFIGEEDRSVHRFRGQSGSYDAPAWHETPEYQANVLPPWNEFVRGQTTGYISTRLPKLPMDLPSAALLDYRTLLKGYFEVMFDFAVDAPDAIDSDQFWDDVSERPDDFVSSDRIPEGTRFDNPLKLSEVEFIRLYTHVQKCQAKRREVEPEKRFIFEKSATDAAIAADRARRLKLAQEKKRLGTAAAPSGQSHGDDPQSRASPTPPPEPPSGPQPPIPSPGLPIRSLEPPVLQALMTSLARGDAGAVQTNTAEADTAEAPTGTPAGAAPAAELAAGAAPSGPITDTEGAAPAQAPTHGHKRKRRASITPAPEIPADGLGTTGYNTRNRSTRRPVNAAAMGKKNRK